MATVSSPTRSIGSSSRQQWNEDEHLSQPILQLIASSNPSPVSVSQPILQPSSPRPTTTVDDLRRFRQVGSGSRSQWGALDNNNHHHADPPAIATKQPLDEALEDVTMAMTSSERLGDDDIMSAYMQSVATYDHSEATARTGHISSFNHISQVTPERGERSRMDEEDEETTLATQKPRSIRSLFMCGAIDENNELRESIQDVNATVRQIFTTVRSFGPEEKDAVRETVREASHFMREKVRSALLRNSDCDKNDSDTISQYSEPIDESPNEVKKAEKVSMLV